LLEHFTEYNDIFICYAAQLLLAS